MTEFLKCQFFFFEMTEFLKMSVFFQFLKRQSSPIPPEELSDMPELSLCKY